VHFRRAAVAVVALGALVVVSGCGSAARSGRSAAAPDPVVAPPATSAATGATVDLSGQPTAPKAVGPPTSLSIPDIGVHSEVIDLGRNPDGSLQVPATTTEVGWYDLGAAPGEVGPAVILGHVDSYAGPGIFFYLKDLTTGDTIDVTSGATQRTFVVTATASYSKDDFPTARVFGPVPDAELRLITCGGPFDHRIGHYDDNVVVYATLSS
jgi:sortase (surface protein transpeptidase)